jgi:hypothetical protein
MFISVERYGTEWLFPTSFANVRYVVIFMFLLSIYGLVRPLLKEWRMAGGAGGIMSEFNPVPKIDVQTLLYLFFIGIFGYAMWEASTWNHDARIVPNIVGYFGLGVIAISMINHVFRRAPEHEEGSPEAQVRKTLHLDLTVRGPKMDAKTLATRSLSYMAWLLGFLLSSALVGILFTVFLFVIAYMRVEGKEPWKMTILSAIGLFAFAGFLFDELLALPWPQAEIADVYVVTKEALLDLWNAWFLE